MKMKISRSTIQRLVTLGVLIVIGIILSFLSNKFLTPTNLTNVLRQVSMVVIVASAVNLVMITGGLDLSIGGVLAFSGVVMAQFAVAGYPVWLSMVFAVFAGALIGVINGSLIVGTKMTPVIATIGTMYITRGLAFVVSGGHSVTNGLPDGFDFISIGRVGPIPLLVIIMFAVFFVFWIILNRTLLGKYVYALGGSEETTRLSGVSVGRIRFAIYTISGALAGFAGALMASRLSAGDPNVGQGFEFDVVVAIVLGGTSLSGGEGSLTGTLIGALIVAILTNGMNLIGIGSIYQYIVEGIVLVIAVVIDLALKGKGIKFKSIKRRVTGDSL